MPLTLPFNKLTVGGSFGTVFAFCILSLACINFANAQIVVGVGDEYNITASNTTTDLTNLGNINLQSGTLTVSNMTQNSGTIDIDTSARLTVKNGDSTGDDSLKGDGTLGFTAGTTANWTTFNISGENENFGGNTEMLGAYTQVTLNSTKGLGTNGSIRIANANANLILDIDDTQTLSKYVYGTTGNITKIGSGDLYLGGNVNFTGAAFVNVLEGNVYLNPDQSVFSAMTAVASGANVYYDLVSDATLYRYIRGDGDIYQRGNYTLSMNTQNSLFYGTYHLTEGTLLFTGMGAVSPTRFGGDVIVSGGATIGGYGRIDRNLELQSGSTLFVGFGSIYGNNITAGNISFGDNSVFRVYAYDNDTVGKLSAIDALSIGNGVNVDVLASRNTSSYWKIETNYLIAEAGYVNGTFSGVTSNLAFLTPTLTYENNAVGLTLRRNDTPFDALNDLTYNQKSTARAAESLSANDTVHLAALNADNASAKILFNELSGEIYASTLGSLKINANEVRNIILSHMVDKNAKSFDNRTNSSIKYQDWISVWGKTANAKKSDYADIDSDTYGFLLGFDTLVSDDTLLGVALSYEKTDSDANSIHSNNEIDTFYVSAYADKAYPLFSLRGGILGSLSEVSTHRYVSEFGDKLTASYNSYIVQLFVEGSKDFALNDKWIAAPYLNLAYLFVNADGFKESGGVSALKIDGNRENIGFSTLGVRTNYLVGKETKLVANLGWQYAFGDVTGETKNRFIAGGDSFNIKGVPVSKNSVLVDLGIDIILSNTISISSFYEGIFSENSKEHNGHLRLNYRF